MVIRCWIVQQLGAGDVEVEISSTNVEVEIDRGALSLYENFVIPFFSQRTFSLMLSLDSNWLAHFLLNQLLRQISTSNSPLNYIDLFSNSRNASTSLFRALITVKMATHMHHIWKATMLLLCYLVACNRLVCCILRRILIRSIRSHSYFKNILACHSFHWLDFCQTFPRVNRRIKLSIVRSTSVKLVTIFIAQTRLLNYKNA